MFIFVKEEDCHDLRKLHIPYDLLYYVIRVKYCIIFYLLCNIHVLLHHLRDILWGIGISTCGIKSIAFDKVSSRSAPLSYVSTLCLLKVKVFLN